MSLLMQALKKAERAKRSGLQEREPDDTELEPRPPAREPYPYVAEDSPASSIKHELSLEPIEPAMERPHDPVPPQARHEVPHPEARIEPDMRLAEEAPMATPVDLDAIAAASADTGRAARFAGNAADAAGNGARSAGDSADHAEDGRPEPSRGNAGHAAGTGADAGRAGAAARAARGAAGESAAARRAAASASNAFAAQGATLAAKGPARARTAADIPSEHRGLDPARLRIAGLSGLLVLILGIFGYVYWKAAMAPGPGAGLPMVPMPPPSATGASGIIVVPGATPAGAGQYAGGPGIAADPSLAQGGATPAAIPGTSIATAPGAASPAAPPAAVASTAPQPSPTPVADAAGGGAATAAVQPVRERAPAARPAASRTTVPAGPSAAQLASIEDPAMRREAMREAAERQARAIQEVQAAQGAMPAAAGADPATLAATAAPASAGGAAPAALAGGEVRISRSSNAAVVNPSIQSGYAAFQSGDLAMARQQYQLALGQDPTSRDALLGLAAVALRERQGQQAAATYTRLLELDAGDPDALSGLVSLGAGDMQHSESRLKELLRRKPEAGPVHFALGNLYAKQARWNEAQQSFFRAYTAAPSNPDYAFNLAVGLDRLNQPRLAASYYQRALLLVQTVPASFDRTAAERRLQELGGPAAAP